MKSIVNRIRGLRCIYVFLFSVIAKSKIRNKGNTAGKRGKDQRKLQKNREKHTETPGKRYETVREPGKHNIEGITMIITGIKFPKQNGKTHL